MEDGDVECRQTGLVFGNGDFREGFRKLVERYRVVIRNFVVVCVQRYSTSEGVKSRVLKMEIRDNLETVEYQEWAMFGIEVFRMKDFVYKIRDKIRLGPSYARWDEGRRLWRWLWGRLNFRLWRATASFFCPVSIQFGEGLVACLNFWLFLGVFLLVAGTRNLFGKEEGGELDHKPFC